MARVRTRSNSEADSPVQCQIRKTEEARKISSNWTLIIIRPSSLRYVPSLKEAVASLKVDTILESIEHLQYNWPENNNLQLTLHENVEVFIASLL